MALNGVRVDFFAKAIRVVGDLILDYVPVRCVADIELTTYQGTGHLDVLAEAASPG
jgi:hypothetical protein